MPTQPKGLAMTKKMILAAMTTAVLCGLTWNAQSQPQPQGSDLLLKLEADFAQATADHGFDGFMSYFADDGADLPNGGTIITGKENIRKELGPWTPDVSLTWTPVHADMAASGDLGYTYGTYVYKAKD